MGNKRDDNTKKTRQALLNGDLVSSFKKRDELLKGLPRMPKATILRRMVSTPWDMVSMQRDMISMQMDRAILAEELQRRNDEELEELRGAP